MPNCSSSLCSQPLVHTRTSLLFYVLAILFFVALNFLLMHFFFPSNNMFDVQRILELVFVTYVALLLVAVPRYGKAAFQVIQRLKPVSRLLILLFFTLGIFSSSRAAKPVWALLDVTLYFLLFVGSCGIAASVDSEKKDRILYAVLLVSVVQYILMFAGLYVYVFHAMPLSQNIFSQQILFPGFVNIRFFAQYQVWLVPLLVWPLMQEAFFRWWKPLLWILVSVWWALLFYNASRGECIALAVAGIAVWFIFRERAYRLYRLQSVGIASGFILYQIVFKFLLRLPKEFAFSRTPDDTYDRLANLKHAFQLIRTHPFLGVGPMHFAYYPPPNYFTHPHNSVLALACEWGMPAALIVLFLFFKGFILWIKRFSYQNKEALFFSVTTQNFSMCLTASIIAGFFYSLVDGVFTMPMGQWTAMIFIGWVMGFYQRFNVVHILPMRLHLRFLVPLFLILAVLILWGIVLPMLPNLSLNELTWLQNHPETGDMFHPNFWIQGLIF